MSPKKCCKSQNKCQCESADTPPIDDEETVQSDIQAELKAEIQKWQDLALRSQAEMENLRKRTQIDVEKAKKYATFSFAKDLLAVNDYLSGAIDCATSEMAKSETESPFLKNLIAGIEMTQKQLLSVFDNQGIKKMPTTDIVFDPNLHKVIQEVADETKPAGTIINELQAGYTIGGDRVLREAMVIVSK